MNHKWTIVVAVLLLTMPLVAQGEFPRAQVFGGYSYFNLDTAGLDGRQNLNGWNGQASYNFNRWLGVTADFGGYYGTVFGFSAHDYSYLFGPTVTYRAQHVEPFFHALFGGNRISGSGYGISSSDNAFAFALGGGLDVPLKGRLGIRVAQVDWLRSNHPGQAQNNVRVSTGVIFRFGQ